MWGGSWLEGGLRERYGAINHWTGAQGAAWDPLEVPRADAFPHLLALKVRHELPQTGLRLLQCHCLSLDVADLFECLLAFSVLLWEGVDMS